MFPAKKNAFIIEILSDAISTFFLPFEEGVIFFSLDEKRSKKFSFIFV